MLSKNCRAVTTGRTLAAYYYSAPPLAAAATAEASLSDSDNNIIVDVTQTPAEKGFRAHLRETKKNYIIMK